MPDLIRPSSFKEFSFSRFRLGGRNDSGTVGVWGGSEFLLQEAYVNATADTGNRRLRLYQFVQKSSN